MFKKCFLGKWALCVFALTLMVFSKVWAQKKEPLFKVMTYNIWNGFDWGEDLNRKKECIAWIKSQGPDVLALQELCGYTEEQLREDARKWGHPYVQLLKTDGYPTALTSKQPIALKERAIDSFWHGMLHCKTFGVDFFVVHLSPADVATRYREAQQIAVRIKTLKNHPYIILGDFNALSPIDAQRMEKKDNLRLRYAKTTNDQHSNLRLGEFDYSVMATFLALPSVDLCLGKTALQKGYSFPTSALLGNPDHTEQSLMANRQRIDFILASPLLAKSCVYAQVLNQEGTHQLSDHYPVMAEFNRKEIPEN
ncbi:MAG: endonuclease/exonuclease/phosphatase family protein [Bacteroidota bacterium]